MGYIEHREAALLREREDWVKAQISKVKDARAEIEAGFARGEEHPMVRYVGVPVGYADRIFSELRSWYVAEPSAHGKVDLYMANDDRNNADSIVARLA